MYKVLIVEDDPGVSMTLEDRLLAEGYQVICKTDGIRGELAAKESGYDVIILDIMLPGRDGFSICKNLREAGSQVPILMLTARTTDLDIVMGLRQGADDYLAKPFDMGVLLARIEALLRRSEMVKQESFTVGNIPDKIEFGDFVLVRSENRLFHKDKDVSLNTQEYRLLEYLLRYPGIVITRNRLLDEVWGYECETTTRTVDVHIGKLRQKLGETEVPHFIHTIRGRGYRFVL